MFTGIIRHIGRIQAVRTLGDEEAFDKAGLEVQIEAPSLPMQTVQIGDSIAVQGACMTVVKKVDHSFYIHISRESLNRTVGLDQVGLEVNLETAMRLGDTLDGHIVSGHVDGVGRISCLQAVGESHELRIDVPKALAVYVAYKGSITINGISLTINQVRDHAQGCEVSINIIPHTIAQTTLRQSVVGDSVNLEIDMLARYATRYLQYTQSGVV